MDVSLLIEDTTRPAELILDSGAFAAWNSNATIDIDKYIDFCQEHDWVSYYVALDVIPGTPGGRMTPDLIQKACQQSWDNYQKMIQKLPMEKVIPVFHQNDDFDWLDKYIDFGVPYLGISPANDKQTGKDGNLGFNKDFNTKSRKNWLNEVKDFVIGYDGKLKIKTHGFAVTSFDLMKLMPWYSVDSASWIRSAANGCFYMPVDGFGNKPWVLPVSPKSSIKGRGEHIENLSWNALKKILIYLDEFDIKLGHYSLRQEKEGYTKGENELWWDKNKNQIMEIIQRGIQTCHHLRFFLNAYYLVQAEKEIDTVERIYFAGALGSLYDEIEYVLNSRLLSYHDIKNSKKCYNVFLNHKTRLQVYC